MALLELDSSFRRALRAAAHALRPVVQIGDKGLTPAVLAEIDRALTAHGLIKVRVAGDDRAVRQEIQNSVADGLSCAPVHHLGKVLVFYRPTEADPQGAVYRDDQAGGAAKTAKPASSSAAYVPKRLAAEGHTEAPRRRRAARPVREDTSSLSPRERYLGTSERAPRPTLHRKSASAGGKRTATGGRGSAFSLSTRRRRG
ncbi:MAG: YhbY family RNA-binding protein [Pigmentiphaga sp.]|nr:YhbY family RNA-binding protein [Pigmentiphaga sp.]